MKLTNCHGLGSSYAWTWGDTPYAEPPTGWEHSRTTLFDVFVNGWECERISWGPYERPIQFIIEGHNNHYPPEPCDFERPFAIFLVLTSIWFNDTEVAAYARDVAQMPVYDGSLSMVHVQDPVSGIVSAEMTWGLPGQAESHVGVQYALAGEQDGFMPHLELYWWQHGANLTRMAWIDDGSGADEGVLSALQLGTMEEPMIVSHAPSGQWTGKGTYYTGWDYEATFMEYADTLCQQPIP